MNEKQQSEVEACAKLSASGKISFGEVVSRLTGVGIERYHADYTRHENTYYSVEGESLVIPLGPPLGEIGQVFDAKAVERSVRQSQKGEIVYPQFVAQTTAAGCVGYFVQLTGRRVQYFGRNGEIHTELFPGVKS